MAAVSTFMENINKVLSLKVSLYWKIQVLAWSLMAVYWGYVAYKENDFIWTLGIADFVLDIFVGISLTHCYRIFAIKNGWLKLGLKDLVPKILTSILVLSTLYVCLIIAKLYGTRLMLLDKGDQQDFSYFKALYLQLFITGSRLMAIWILAYHLYHYAIREIEIVKDNARLSLALKEAQLIHLTSQLNPHFLFNALNNIKYLINEKPQSARRAIDLLADLLRSSLHMKAGDPVPLFEEIELIKDFLELQKLRFEDRLDYKIEVDSNMTHVLILPLSIQLLVENAVKHGIEKKIQNGFIKLKVEKADNSISIVVENSGSYDEPISKSGIGLENLRNRLMLHYNGKASFDIKSIGINSVEAKILIPLS